MKTNYLLPHAARKYGVIIVGIMLLISTFWTDIRINWYAPNLFDLFYDIITNNPNTLRQLPYYFGTRDLWLTIQGISMVSAATLILFAKEKIEDEYTAKLRLESLLWSCRALPFFGILAFFSNEGLIFIAWMAVMGVLLPAMAFIRFKLILFKYRKGDETGGKGNSINIINTDKIVGLLDRKYLKYGYAMLLISITFDSIGRYYNIARTVGIPNFALIDYVFDLIRFRPGNVGTYFHIFPISQISGILLITGLTILILCKEKIEDEYLYQLRLESFLWAFYSNTIYLIVANATIWGLAFLRVWDIEAIAIPILIYLRFKYLVYKSKLNMELSSNREID